MDIFNVITHSFWFPLYSGNRSRKKKTNKLELIPKAGRQSIKTPISEQLFK